LAICDYFKWTFTDIRDLSLLEYHQVVEYLKKVNRENKKAANRAKKR